MHDEPAQSLDAKRREILADHRALAHLLRALDHPPDHRVHPLLRELVDVLARHFARETGDDGLFEIIAAHDPSAAPRLRQLERQHAAILSQVEEARARARDCVDVQVRIGIGRFLAALRVHEREEAGLLIRALARGGPHPHS